MSNDITSTVGGYISGVRQRLDQPDKWDISFHSDNDSHWWRARHKSGVQVDRGDVDDLVATLNKIQAP